MSQSLSKLYVHLVFSTKGRAETLPKQHLSEVHSYISEILQSNHCPTVIVGGTANHVHILYVQAKTVSLSEVVRLVKTNSSKWIRQKNGSLVPFDWQDGYGAFSISQSHVEKVRQYIATQAEHHAKVDFMDEFRRLCSIYDAPIDERFVWD